MDADQDAATIDRLSARAVLDDIREQLNAPDVEPVQQLLKLSKDLADLDEGRLTAAEATAWRARAETKRERSRAMLSLQSGFKRGLLVGFLTGFAICGLFAAMIGMHWMVVMQQ